MDALTEYFANLETATIMGWAWSIIGAVLILIIGRWVVKLVAEHALRRYSRHNERFEVRLINTTEYPFCAAPPPNAGASSTTWNFNFGE